MSRIRSRPEPRPAPLGKIQPMPSVESVTAHIERSFPLMRPFTGSDFFPTNVDADIRALRNWERRRDELLADLPDEGELW